MNDITMKQSIFFQRINQLRIHVILRTEEKRTFFKASPLLSGRVTLKMGIFGNLYSCYIRFETSDFVVP